MTQRVDLSHKSLSMTKFQNTIGLRDSDVYLSTVPSVPPAKSPEDSSLWDTSSRNNRLSEVDGMEGLSVSQVSVTATTPVWEGFDKGGLLCRVVPLILVH